MPTSGSRLHADHDGNASVFVVGLTLALLMVAGLVYDGGRLLANRRAAHHVADNAARAGAQVVDLRSLRAGEAVLLQAAEAEAAANAYLDGVGHTGTVTVTGDRVEVAVTVDVPMRLLGLVGLRTRTVAGTGTAVLVGGVTEPE